MGLTSDFEVGQSVELSDGTTGTVRFVGKTAFSEGDWIGVELEDASGKNDGSVKGQRYFTCASTHGIFIRPTAATVVDQPTPKPAKKTTAANGGAGKTRPSGLFGGGKRPSVAPDPGAARRQSVNASPTPVGRGGASSGRLLASPTKSPTKQLASRSSSGTALRQASTSTTAKPGVAATKRASVAGRPSIAPAARGASGTTAGSSSRLSNVGSNGSAKAPAKGALKPGSRLSVLQSGGSRPASISTSSQASTQSRQESPAPSTDHEEAVPTESEDEVQVSEPELESEAKPEPKSAATTSLDSFAPSALSPSLSATQIRSKPQDTVRTSATTSVQTREIESLKTKVRVLEKKRQEDRERLQAFEKAKIERDRFEGIINKLQAKIQPQHREIQQLKQQLKEAEEQAQSNESTQMDVDSALEMVTLDREIAEEQVETLRRDLETVRGKNEELELELEILREENTEFSREVGSEEKSSQGWLQLERTNERLREALTKLRDISQDNEADMKKQVKELEDEVEELSGYRSKYDELSMQHRQSEDAVQDMREQLEAALSSEEMVEELAEKNLALSEQIEKWKARAEDLEELKELSDEIELNHIENEKQMQDEIDAHESKYLDQVRVTTEQDAIIEDLDYRVSKFRELVRNMQSDLEDMRAAQQINETEASELNERSRAMLDLNMRLQASAAKVQIKVIDVEMNKMEAEQSATHLGIIQALLPESYQDERSAVSALLQFKRISFKANIIHTIIKERVNGVAVPRHEDDMFACCEVLGGLVWASGMCDRFVKFMSSCSLKAFKRFESAIYDLEPVERAFNGWIDSLKRDDFKEKQCASDLSRSIALLTHLAEVHIPEEGLREYAEDAHLRAFAMQNHLDSAASAIFQVKSIAQANVILPEDADEEDEEEAQFFIQKADQAMAQIRSAKVVAGKAIRQLEELQKRSLTLQPSTLPSIEQTQASVSELALACRASGERLCAFINEDIGTTSFTYHDIVRAISQQQSETPFNHLSAKISAAASQIQNFLNLTTTLSQTTEFPASSPAPWILLAQQLRSEAASSAGHEKMVDRLREELSERGTALALKDRAVEEMTVKNEVLEKRVAESGGRREQLRELEHALDSARKSQRETARKYRDLQSDRERLEAEREEWKAKAEASADGQPRGQKGPTATEDGVAPARAQETIAVLNAEIDTLRATIRHIRSSAYSVSLSSAYAFLSSPLLPLTPTTSSKAAQIKQESRSLQKSLLDLVLDSAGAIPQFEKVPSADRLKWRPAKEKMAWKVGRSREEWEGWKDWKTSVVRQASELAGEEKRKAEVGRKDARKRKGLATLDMPPPRIEVGGKDHVVPPGGFVVESPGEWGSLQRRVGIEVV